MGSQPLVNLLLDTHVWLWSLLEPERLRPETIATLENPGNRLYLSPVSVWETLLLAERHKIELAEDPRAWVARVLDEVPIFEAPLDFEIAIDSRSVGLPHKDPADRFLAATARVKNLILLTVDRRLLDCPDVRTIAA